MRPLSPKLSWTLSGQRYQRPTDARDLPLLTPFERPSCSAAHPSAPSGNNGVSEYRSADAGEKIGEIGDLLGCHRLQRLRLGTLHPRRVAGISRQYRLRQRRDEIGE